MVHRPFGITNLSHLKDSCTLTTGEIRENYKPLLLFTCLFGVLIGFTLFCLPFFVMPANTRRAVCSLDASHDIHKHTSNMDRACIWPLSVYESYSWSDPRPDCRRLCDANDASPTLRGSSMWWLSSHVLYSSTGQAEAPSSMDFVRLGT